MNEIFSFVKEIFMINEIDKTPIGLCQFECGQNSIKKPRKIRRKREMRLSELMDK